MSESRTNEREREGERVKTRAKETIALREKPHKMYACVRASGMVKECIIIV